MKYTKTSLPRRSNTIKITKIRQSKKYKTIAKKSIKKNALFLCEKPLKRLDFCKKIINFAPCFSWY